MELHARDPSAKKRLHEAAAQYLIEAGQTGCSAASARRWAQAAAFSLLSEGLCATCANPTVGSALDLDEIRPSCSQTYPSSRCPWRLSCCAGR